MWERRTKNAPRGTSDDICKQRTLQLTHEEYGGLAVGGHLCSCGVIQGQEKFSGGE